MTEIPSDSRNGYFETSAVVQNQGTKQRQQRTLGDCWQWKANGQCSKGDNCSFRHDINKRAKTTQPNSSPSSFKRQNERNTSRTRSPRGKSPSGRMFRLPCKDYLKGICTKSFCKKLHPPECFVLQVRERMQILRKVLLCASPGWRTAWQKGLKIMVTKVQWLRWKVHDNWGAYFRLWSRRSLHRSLSLGCVCFCVFLSLWGVFFSLSLGCVFLSLSGVCFSLSLWGVFFSLSVGCVFLSLSLVCVFSLSLWVCVFSLWCVCVFFSLWGGCHFWGTKCFFLDNATFREGGAFFRIQKLF